MLSQHIVQQDQYMYKWRAAQLTAGSDVCALLNHLGFLLPAVCPLGQGLSVEGTSTTYTTCSPCPSGSFGPEQRNGGDTVCKACPTSSTNIFNFDYNSVRYTYTPAPITVGGATASSQCALAYAAIEDGNW